MPKEHVYNRYEGTVTLDMFFVKRNNLKQLGIASLGEEVLRQDILDILIVTNDDSHTIIRAYRGCSIQDLSLIHI